MKIPCDLFGVILPRCMIYFNLHNTDNICMLRSHINILCFISEEDAAIVYQNASNMKMTGEGFVWLVTQQSFSGNARGVLPQGITSNKLLP